MAKSDRLFRLLHLIRGLTPPVTAARLASAMEVSERTIYRDIESLRLAGARIEGEAGLGYTMIEDPALPPQTFTQIEIEALSLGLSDVSQRGDADLAQAAKDALTKILATLPERQQRQAVHAVNLVHRFGTPPAPTIDMTLLREAMWAEEALDIGYKDQSGRSTQRRIWPLAMSYHDRSVMLLAWCCLRSDFRMFHVTRIDGYAKSEESFRPRRVPLLREYIATLKARKLPRMPSQH
ncbi:YafY family protein [Shimia thalassica]|uniref:helix-turn-helix transcriptional regulator n=1 Tax=Shimia thalassica TaxID=1715693 RepID=UPI000C0877C8|nr:YafY family protein [Shimia thalassica]MDO6483640.1 YafY family protein [Shimia thalassica]MDP2495299.1 YafY family protein [Shimia thalassica]MDP2518758.1 YafY family protein [Shimia thalassica]PHO03756.1 transcriptional regulator [Rhodobacteraceae bacterium 4F10]